MYPEKDSANGLWRETIQKIGYEKLQVLVAVSLTCPHPPVDGHLSLHPGPSHNKCRGYYTKPYDTDSCYTITYYMILTHAIQKNAGQPEAQPAIRGWITHEVGAEH